MRQRRNFTHKGDGGYMKKVISALFVLALALGACTPTRVITFTAANTGIPVLLGPSDSAGPTSGRKCSAANITENNKINIKLNRSMALTSDAARNTTEQHHHSKPELVDVVILKRTLGNKNVNICIDTLETSDLGVYLLFGLVETTAVSMNTHIEKVEKRDAVNQTKVEAQK